MPLLLAVSWNTAMEWRALGWKAATFTARSSLVLKVDTCLEGQYLPGATGLQIFNLKANPVGERLVRKEFQARAI